MAIAWETFGTANGVRSFREMRDRVEALRRGSRDDDRIGCIVLSDVVVLPESEYVAAPVDWKPNVVRIAGYDARVARPDRSPLLITPGGYSEPKLVAARRGQGAFRFMVMDA